MLIVANDGASENWFEAVGLKPERIHRQWSDGRPCTPPRIIVSVTDDELSAIDKLDIVKSITPYAEPFTRTEIAEQINGFYRDGSQEAEGAADALLDLMAYLDGLCPPKNDCGGV